MRFGGLTAVDGLDFTVDEGALVALIGPNGAGKTTAFNVITGVYAPSAGSVRFAGREIGGEPAAPDLGGRRRAHVPEHPPLPLAHRARERAHGGDRQRDARRSETSCAGRAGRAARRSAPSAARDLLARLGLERFADARADSLPYGEQRRLEIARALATGPKLLLLDEPAAGMNPSEKEALRELIALLRGEFGLTIVLIDHDVAFVMNLCERITVLDHGEKIAEGAPAGGARGPEGDRGLPRARGGGARVSAERAARDRGARGALRRDPRAAGRLARRPRRARS